MASIEKKLQELKRKSDQLLDSETEKVNNKVRIFLTNAVGRINTVLNEFETKGKFNAAKADKLIKEVEAAINTAGFGEVKQGFEESFIAVGRDSLTYFLAIEKDGSFRGIDKDTLNLLVRDRVDTFTQLMQEKLVYPMRSQIVQSTVGGKSVVQSVEEIRDFISGENLLRKDKKQYTDSNIETLVADSHRAFHSILREEKAQEIGLEIRSYEGPFDSITRKACQAMLQEAPHGVPGLYYKDEVTTQSMNQIIQKRFKVRPYELLSVDPIVGRGGFNCRHDFYPITIELAKELGFKE